MVLETIRETRLTQPNVSARIHAGTPDRFLLECARTIRLGMGMPAIKNDEIIVPALLEKGVRSEDAYDYAIVGCIEAAVPGKWGYRNTGLSFLNFQGSGDDPEQRHRPRHRHPAAARARDLTAFASIESLYDAYREQLRFYTRLSIEMDTVADLCLEAMAPDAFCSALVDDCIARGKTIKEGGAVHDIISGPRSGRLQRCGLLHGPKTQVFEEKALTAGQVQESLAADFRNPGGERCASDCCMLPSTETISLRWTGLQPEFWTTIWMKRAVITIRATAVGPSAAAMLDRPRTSRRTCR